MTDTSTPSAVCDGQLEFELGEAFAPPRMLIDVSLVVCQLCAGHHPVERCPQTVICSLCSGPHHSVAHLGEAAGGG